MPFSGIKQDIYAVAGLKKRRCGPEAKQALFIRGSLKKLFAGHEVGDGQLSVSDFLTAGEVALHLYRISVHIGKNIDLMRRTDAGKA